MINIYDFICSNSDYFDQLKFGNDKKIFIDYLCPIDVNRARAWSHKNCLLYVVQGIKGYASADHFHQSHAHQLLFIRKGGIILHQHLEMPYRALIFMFDDEAIKEFLWEYPNLLQTDGGREAEFMNLPVVTELGSSPFIASVFMSSLDYLKQPTAESSISLEFKFKELLVNLLRDKDANSFNFYLSQLCHDTSAAFIKLMHENSHYHFTTEELARIACMSLSTFKREFTKHFGVSPGKWLREQRIARAVAMLTNTDTTISEIAFELGYSDAAAFSKAFKLATSQTPSDFLRHR